MAFHEIVDADEAAKFEGYGQEIRAIQKARPGKPDRVMHKKQHLGAMGELVVKAAEGGRFGVFATEQTWPVYARFSNGFGVEQPDKVTDVRGFAMKLVGVPGKKIIAGLEDAQTQDFLFIRIPCCRSATRTSSWCSCAPPRTDRPSFHCVSFLDSASSVRSRSSLVPSRA